MKLKKISILALLFASVVCVSSCSKDEVDPTPQEVENPLENDYYYVTGTVTDASGAPMSDVQVNFYLLEDTTGSNGEYTLASDELLPANYMFFSKEDYIEVISYVAMPSEATRGTKVAVDAVMVQKAAAETVTATEGATVTASATTDAAVTSSIEIVISSDVFSEDAEVSATAYTPGTSAEVIDIDETSSLDVTYPNNALNLEFSAELEADVIITYPADQIAVSRTSTQYFDNVKTTVYDPSLAKWVESGDATYNEGGYEVTLTNDMLDDDFNVQIGVAPVITVAAAASSITLGTEVVDNIGAMNAVTETIGYTKKSGLAVTSTDKDGLYAQLINYAETMLGQSEGVTESSVSEEAVVSGDKKITVKYTQATTTYTLSASTSTGTISVTLTSYGAVSSVITTQYGNLTTGHNN